jgi:hypothetical protein
LLALRYTLRLRRALRVRSAEWWLDAARLPPVRWASYVVLGDRRAEVLLPGGESQRFLEQRVALDWLKDEGFVHADQALEQRLVNRLPTND